jgi:predicted DNA-binding protein with PD1-like motif
MRSHEATLGRIFVVTFDHGDNFFKALAEFCEANEVMQGYIPSFIAGFSSVDVVGACDKLDDPKAPVWSKVHLANVEAFGGGNLAYDQEAGRVAPHIHVAVGLKHQSATGYTSHLLDATVQFLTEMLVVEVADPVLLRVKEPSLYDAPLLRVGGRRTPTDTGRPPAP